jgi:hypothetical protein
LIRGIDCDPVPVDVVQALLGHAALSSTQVYTHDAEAAMNAATIAIAARPAPGARRRDFNARLVVVFGSAEPARSPCIGVA